MANDLIFSNNASALLAASIGTGDTTIQLASGFGALFPSPTGGQFFYATLENDTGDIEIVKCTSRTGDNLTVVRAQDGTTAQAFTLTVTRVELRLVSIAMEELLQKNGGTMTGALDMNGFGITDAVLSGVNTQILAGEIVGVPLRGLTGVSTNEIAVPTNGTSRATAGGTPILVQGDDLIPYLDTAGIINLSSGTTGTRTADGAWFRVYDSGGTDYMELDVTDAEALFKLGGGATHFRMSGDLRLDLNTLSRAKIKDVSFTKQDVTGASTTAINYSNGQYVDLDLPVNISTFSITNASSQYAFVRLKCVQGSGGQTITWPANYKWPEGVAPTLSTGAGEIDFIDLWTDDFGTTWYGAYNTNWS